MNSKTVLDGSKSFLIKMENWAVFKQYSSSCNQRKIYKWHSNFREILQKNNTKKEHFNFCTLRRASRPCFFKMLRCKIFGFQDLGEESDFTFEWSGSMDNFVRLFHPFQIWRKTRRMMRRVKKRKWLECYCSSIMISYDKMIWKYVFIYILNYRRWYNDSGDRNADFLGCNNQTLSDDEKY